MRVGTLRQVVVWLRPVWMCTAVLVGAVAVAIGLLAYAPGGALGVDAATTQNGGGASDAMVAHLISVARADFGISIAWRPGASVIELVGSALWRSLSIVLPALLLAMGLASMGVALSTRRPALRGTIHRIGALISATPVFLAAVILWIFAGPALGLVPDARHVMLAVLVLALSDGVLIDLIHHLDAEVDAACRTPHVEAARANGDRLGYMVALTVAPAISGRLVARLSLLLGAVMLVEVPFGLAGIGRMLYEAAATRDTPLVVGCIVALAGVVAAAHLLAELMLLATRPALRISRGAL